MCGLALRAEQSSLIFIEKSFVEQAADSNNRIHRRANFVAHMREKNILQLVCLFELYSSMLKQGCLVAEFFALLLQNVVQAFHFLQVHFQRGLVCLQFHQGMSLDLFSMLRLNVRCQPLFQKRNVKRNQHEFHLTMN